MYPSLNIAYSDNICGIQFDNSKEKKRFRIGCVGMRTYAGSCDCNMRPGNEIANLQIGNYCSLGRYIQFYFSRNHDYKAISTSAWLPLRHDFTKKGQIIIGNDVWIGDRALLMPSIIVGDGAVIGTGTVVAKDIPPYAIAVGNPMRIIKYRFDEEQIRKLMQIKWWDWPHEIVDRRRDYFGGTINNFIKQFEKHENDTTVYELKTKTLPILFYPDFDDSYPIWPSVLTEYISTFKDNDNVSLVVRISPGPDFQRNLDSIQKNIPSEQNFPDILIVGDQLENEAVLFPSCTHFITTRSSHTIRQIGFCRDFNLKVLSGVDRPIFDHELLGQVLAKP